MKKSNIFSKITRFVKKINVFVNVDIKHEVQKQNFRDYYTLKAIEDVSCGINKYDTREVKITISLTTYSERIYDVFKTIQSLFSQSMKADRIILWLAEDEFCDRNLPLILNSMKERGLEICYCEDLRSYKKLIPTLSKYPEDIIITVDDDIIYPNDLVESLYKEYLKNSDKVIFNLGKKIKLSYENSLAPYDDWDEKGGYTEASFMLMGVGVGGILYPPNSLDKEVMNKEKFMKLAPHADDLWFKSMALKKGTMYIQTSYGKPVKGTQSFLKRFITIEDEQSNKLGTINVIEKRNDIQFKAILDEYELWNMLK